MKTKRKARFSLGMKIATILSCVALVSVGFATWWIIKPADPISESGSFTVYGVSEKAVTLSNADIANDAIVFGYETSTPAPTNSWLYPNNVLEQNLSSTLSFDVDVSETGTSDNLGVNALVDKVVVELVPSNVASLNTAIAAGYVNAPTLTYGNITDDFSDGVLKIEISAADFTAAHKDIDGVEFAFTWGATFGSKNPYLYYNNMAYDAAIGNQEAHDHANEHLAALNTALYRMTYTINISAVAKSVG